MKRLNSQSYEEYQYHYSHIIFICWRFPFICFLGSGEWGQSGEWGRRAVRNDGAITELHYANLHLGNLEFNCPDSWCPDCVIVKPDKTPQSGRTRKKKSNLKKK